MIILVVYSLSNNAHKEFVVLVCMRETVHAHMHQSLFFCFAWLYVPQHSVILTHIPHIHTHKFMGIKVQ